MMLAKFGLPPSPKGELYKDLMFYLHAFTMKK
jgi:hypothetical protein